MPCMCMLGKALPVLDCFHFAAPALENAHQIGQAGRRAAQLLAATATAPMRKLGRNAGGHARLRSSGRTCARLFGMSGQPDLPVGLHCS